MEMAHEGSISLLLFFMGPDDCVGAFVLFSRGACVSVHMCACVRTPTSNSRIGKPFLPLGNLCEIIVKLKVYIWSKECSMGVLLNF